MDHTDDKQMTWPETALQHLDALSGFAMSLTGNSADAEDLVQDTFTQAASHHHKLAPNSNLKGWLFIVMRNTWLNQVRQTRNRPQFVELFETHLDSCLNDVGSNPQDLYVRLWERDEIRAALQSLSVSNREIIILRDIEGFSYQEIAEILNCPLGTIMSRLSRARNKLKKKLSTGEASLKSAYLKTT